MCSLRCRSFPSLKPGRQRWYAFVLLTSNRQNLLNEPITEEGGWEEVPGATNYEGVAACHSRVYCVNENYDELYISKASSLEVNCTLDQVG
jgi:hypothetical protein